VSRRTTSPSRFEPLYDIHPLTEATFEVFYADTVLALSFGLCGSGWCWWLCSPDDLPDGPVGPFATSYAAYRDAIISR
jgi:hypothetical protein